MRLDAELHVGIHAGLERAGRIGEFGLDQHGLARVVEHSGGAGELAFEGLGARGFREDAHGLSGRGESGFDFRQGGLHAHAGEVGQDEEGGLARTAAGRGGDERAEVDGATADDAGERRADLREAEEGGVALLVGLGDRELGHGGVHLLARHEVRSLLVGVLGALGFQFGDRELVPRTGFVGDELRDFEFGQHGAGFDAVADVDAQGLHVAADLGVEGDLLAWADFAEQLHGARDVPGLEPRDGEVGGLQGEGAQEEREELRRRHGLYGNGCCGDRRGRRKGRRGRRSP